MKKYAVEQIEAMASDLRGAPGTSMVGTHISLSADKAVAMYEVLRAYAATLRQQGEQAGVVVSDEVTERAWVAHITSRGWHPYHYDEQQKEQQLGMMRAALEAVAPILRAPVELGGRVDGWQPIETAPTSNKRPLLIASFNDLGKIRDFDFNASWESESESWEIPQVYYFWASENGNVEEPTHWMYQPEWFDKLSASPSPDKEGW